MLRVDRSCFHIAFDFCRDVRSLPTAPAVHMKNGAQSGRSKSVHHTFGSCLHVAVGALASSGWGRPLLQVPHLLDTAAIFAASMLIRLIRMSCSDSDFRTPSASWYAISWCWIRCSRIVVGNICIFDVVVVGHTASSSFRSSFNLGASSDTTQGGIHSPTTIWFATKSLAPIVIFSW